MKDSWPMFVAVQQHRHAMEHAVLAGLPPPIDVLYLQPVAPSPNLTRIRV